MGKLTALTVKAAKAPGRYSDGDGLMLYVQRNGSRSWVLRIQINGQRRDFGLGSETQVKLAEAREKAAEIRKQWRSGIDPIEQKRLDRINSRKVPTFAEAARTVFKEQQSSWRNDKHKAQWLSSLEAYAFPKIGSSPIDKIDAPEIRELLLPIWLEKPETARRVRQRVGTVLDWAYSNGFRQAEAPMRSISKGLPRQPSSSIHFTAMPHPDVANLMALLSETDSVGRLALRFAILTAARSGEVRGARWTEIADDLSLWTVPAERMKANREHVVPLCEGAKYILRKMKAMKSEENNNLVFPGQRGKQMSDMTLTKALRSVDETKATVHGFRSSFRDWAAEKTSFPGDVVEAALAHTNKNKVEAAYRRTNYLDRRRDLMAAWASYLVTQPDNVVSITNMPKSS